MTDRYDITGTSQGNLTYQVTVNYEGAVLDLSTVNGVTAYIKASRNAADNTGHSYSIGTGLTVTNSAGGVLTWVIPMADVGANKWYRIDVIDQSNSPNPALYGTLTVVPV